MVEKKINDIVIVGAGPAGLTASIYAARAGLSAVVLDDLERRAASLYRQS